MNIKNYLHLYLPFEAVIAPVLENENNTKVEITSLDVWKERCYDTDGFDWSFKNVLPILKKFSYREMPEVDKRRFEEETEETLNYYLLTAKQVVWLLQNHYDIFGLIEKGLAINASEVSANG